MLSSLEHTITTKFDCSRQNASTAEAASCSISLGKSSLSACITTSSRQAATRESFVTVWPQPLKCCGSERCVCVEATWGAQGLLSLLPCP